MPIIVICGRAHLPPLRAQNNRMANLFCKNFANIKALPKISKSTGTKIVPVDFFTQKTFCTQAFDLGIFRHYCTVFA